MGIIIRQSIKSSIATYFGTGIGVLSSIFIYPASAASLALYGTIQFIIDAAALLANFGSMGVNALTIKFFPEFEDKERQNHGFLGILILLSILGMLISGLLVFFLRAPLMQFGAWLDISSDLFKTHTIGILAITFCTIFINLGINYTSNYKRIVVPKMIQDLGLKITLPIFILAFTWQLLEATQVEYLMVGVFFLILICIFLYLVYLGGLDWKANFSRINKGLAKRMGVFAAYGILSGVSGLLMLRIDSIMVATMISEEANGIYKISSLIILTMAIPMNAIIKISDPIISRAWKDQNLKEIGELYRKSSTTLLVAGMFIFLGIWVSVEELFRLTGNFEAMILGRYVILFIGLGKLFDLMSGINGSIIILSKYFRFHLITVMVLAVANIILNIILIPKYQIAGAALATMISLMLYNLVKFVFIWWKFKMQPFRFKVFKVLALGALSAWIAFYIPSTNLLLLDILINSLWICLSFFLPAIYFRFSEEISDFYFVTLKAIKLYLNRLFSK